MPGRGVMRAKQNRAGSLGQGARFYVLGGKMVQQTAGAQGYGKTNPSIGSMKSLGVMKQNRNAGGNNVCNAPTNAAADAAGCTFCIGPKAYCQNCSGRKTAFNTITGGGSYAATTGFSLTTH